MNIWLIRLEGEMFYWAGGIWVDDPDLARQYHMLSEASALVRSAWEACELVSWDAVVHLHKLCQSGNSCFWSGNLAIGHPFPLFS